MQQHRLSYSSLVTLIGLLAVNVNGFIAHELAEVVPEAVTGTKDAMMDEEYEVTRAVVDDEGERDYSSSHGYTLCS